QNYRTQFSAAALALGSTPPAHHPASTATVLVQRTATIKARQNAPSKQILHCHILDKPGRRRYSPRVQAFGPWPGHADLCGLFAIAVRFDLSEAAIAWLRVAGPRSEPPRRSRGMVGAR